MKSQCRLVLVLTAAAGLLLHCNLSADEKKDPDKKPQPKETIVNDELIKADLKDKYVRGVTAKPIRTR